jgi:type IV pilus assembly protein PilP
MAACDDQSGDELKSWMEQTRRQLHPPPQKLVSGKVFQPFRYEVRDRIEPYDFTKISRSLAELQSGGVQPDLRRQREPLENYPLDSLKLVGSLRKTGKVLGLVEIDRTIYQVSIGSHLGQDFGRVVAITDSAIDIDEMLQETGGSWTTRRVRLALQERKP